MLTSTPYSYAQKNKTKSRSKAPRIQAGTACNPDEPFIKETNLICGGCKADELCATLNYDEGVASIKRKWLTVIKTEAAKKRIITAPGCQKVLDGLAQQVADENFANLQTYKNHQRRDKSKDVTILMPVDRNSVLSAQELSSACGGSCDDSINSARGQVAEIMSGFSQLSAKDVADNVNALRQTQDIPASCHKEFDEKIKAEFVLRMKSEISNNDVVANLNKAIKTLETAGTNQWYCLPSQEPGDGSSGNGNGKVTINGDAMFGDANAPKDSVGRPFCMNQTDSGMPVKLDFEPEKNPAKTKVPQCLVTAKQMYDLWAGQISSRIGRSLKKFDPWVKKENALDSALNPFISEQGLLYWKECAEKKLTYDLAPSVDALVNFIKKDDPSSPIAKSDLIADDFPNGDELARLAESNDPKKFSIACDLLEGKACLNARPKLREGVKVLEGESPADSVKRILMSATGTPDGRTFISDDAQRDNFGTAYVDGVFFSATEAGNKIGVDRTKYLNACGSDDPTAFAKTREEFQEWHDKRSTEVAMVWTTLLTVATAGAGTELAVAAKGAMTVAQYTSLATKINLASQVLWMGGMEGGFKTYSKTGDLTLAAESLVINSALVGIFHGVGVGTNNLIGKAAQTKFAQATLTKAQRYIPSGTGSGMVPLTVSSLTKIIKEIAPHVPAATTMFVASCAMEQKCDWNTVVKTLGITATGVLTNKMMSNMISKPLIIEDAPNIKIPVATDKDYQALGIKPSDLDGKTPEEAQAIISKAFRNTIKVGMKKGDIHPDLVPVNGTNDAKAQKAVENFMNLTKAKEVLLANYANKPATEVNVKTAQKSEDILKKAQDMDLELSKSRQTDSKDLTSLEFKAQKVQEQKQVLLNLSKQADLPLKEKTTMTNLMAKNKSEEELVTKQIQHIKNELVTQKEAVDEIIIEGKQDQELMLSLKEHRNEPIRKFLNSDAENKKAFLELVNGDKQTSLSIKNYLKKADIQGRNLFTRIVMKIRDTKNALIKKNTVNEAKEVLNNRSCGGI